MRALLTAYCEARLELGGEAVSYLLLTTHYSLLTKEARLELGGEAVAQRGAQRAARGGRRVTQQAEQLAQQHGALLHLQPYVAEPGTV
eukprot:scaffold52964_cov61-Phaeocystis_antarctica.AAC.2